MVEALQRGAGNQAVARLLKDGSRAVRPPGRALQRLGDLTKVPPGMRCPVATSTPPPAVESIMFDNEQSTVSATHRGQISNFVMNWRAGGGTAPIRVDGFASAPGADELNWQLSCSRAHSVAGELQSPASGPGVPAGRVKSYAHGETSEFGAPDANRRVTLHYEQPAETGPNQSVLPSDPTRCRVDVRATHIGGLLSGAPVWHLLIVHRDDTGIETGWRGGPGGGAGGGHGHIHGQTGLYAPGFVDYDPSSPSITVGSGAAMCAKTHCFQTELTRINGTRTPYDPMGPNSNTWVKTVLDNCGLPTRKPVAWTPGFDDPKL
jgi:hypothetical protein